MCSAKRELCNVTQLLDRDNICIRQSWVLTNWNVTYFLFKAAPITEIQTYIEPFKFQYS